MKLNQRSCIAEKYCLLKKNKKTPPLSFNLLDCPGIKYKMKLNAAFAQQLWHWRDTLHFEGEY